MMVNMILPGDWVRNKGWNYFLSPKPAKTMEEVNRELSGYDFQIPADWRPIR
jgi:hypothetical protein